MQRTGARRFAQRQIERQRRLVPVADLVVRLHHAHVLLITHSTRRDSVLGAASHHLQCGARLHCCRWFRGCVAGLAHLVQSAGASGALACSRLLPRTCCIVPPTGSSGCFSCHLTESRGLVVAYFFSWQVSASLRSLPVLWLSSLNLAHSIITEYDYDA